jgi:CubicO group peptidase (beta-lactamase class C family)
MKAVRRIAVFYLILTFATAAIAQSKEPNADILVGLWGVEKDLGPLVRGELVVDGRGQDWRARVAGYDVPVKRQGEYVGFKLPADAGEFRAHLTAEKRSIIGHWIQPANAVYNNRYASPVVLSMKEQGSWQGEVVPLRERLSFYLSIYRKSDGSLAAFIRNPEFNFFRGRIYRVELEGRNLTLSQNGRKMNGTFDAQADTITLPLLDSAPALLLTRRKDHDAIGYYPRVLPEDERYVYHKPIQENDGWPTAPLAEVGLREQPLARFIEQILQSSPEENLLPLQSLLIARHGKLALEEYFYGFSSDRPHDTRSAGKTWATMLVGVAREHGTRLGPETAVYPLFKQYQPIANWDERKAKLTLRDLMTMTSGFACDDSNDQSPGQEDRMQGQTEQPDWYKYTLDLPMVKDPGGDQAIYCSADINLIGGVVEQATGKWLPDLFEQDFAQPMQIQEYYLNLMPTGGAYMGGGLYMRPRDLLKLGQLYLNGGAWNGKRVLDKAWVEESLRARSTLRDPVGMDHQYGFAWHIYHFDVGRKIYHMYFAGGNGGQLVMIFPELDMVVNYNGGAYGQPQKFFRWQAFLVPQYIIPAALPEARVGGAKPGAPAKVSGVK